MLLEYEVQDLGLLKHAVLDLEQLRHKQTGLNHTVETDRELREIKKEPFLTAVKLKRRMREITNSAKKLK